MTRFFLYIIIGIAPISWSFGQQEMDISKLFDKVEKSYNNNNHYCYVSTYKLYENTVSLKVVEQYAGLIFKKGKNCYQKLSGTEFVNLGEYNVMVNHKEKLVQISKITSQSEPIALKSFLNYFPKTKIVKDEKYWICELTAGDDLQKQFSKINIYINKSNFSLFKQVFFIVGSQEVKKGNKKAVIKNPRLEVVYQEKMLSAAEDQLVTKENYFSIKNKKFILSKRFKGYKLITI